MRYQILIALLLIPIVLSLNACEIDLKPKLIINQTNETKFEFLGNGTYVNGTMYKLVLENCNKIVEIYPQNLELNENETQFYITLIPYVNLQNLKIYCLN